MANPREKKRTVDEELMLRQKNAWEYLLSKSTNSYKVRLKF